VNISYKGAEYQVSTKLDVAFQMQKGFGKKPYMEILEDIAEMPLEDQIKFLYIALVHSNPGVCNLAEFTEYMIESSNLDQLITMVQELGEGILYQGYTPEQIAEKKARNQELAAQAPRRRRG
jgi:hypothetical protein